MCSIACKKANVLTSYQQGLEILRCQHCFRERKWRGCERCTCSSDTPGQKTWPTFHSSETGQNAMNCILIGLKYNIFTENI